MKSIAFIALIALIASFATPRAEADDKTRALVGGLIGGIIIGKVLSDDDHRHHSEVSVSYRGHHRERGHYEWVTTKHWVPGYYATEYDRRGRPYRVWMPGRYTYEKEKVWVSHHRGSHYSRHHSHHHRPSTSVTIIKRR